MCRPRCGRNARWSRRGRCGHLHLFAAQDLPLVVAARNARANRYWIKNFASYGISEEQYDMFLAAVPHLLGGEPLTREQLAAAAAQRTGIDRLQPALTEPSWGSTLKPSASRGDLCFGPNQGRNVTFVRPCDWLGSWRATDPKAALDEIIRRYLHVYGPATPRDFGRWWGAGTALAKKAFKDLMSEGDLEAVDVEGWKAFALRASIEPMAGRSATGVVRLLPRFDHYTHGLIDCDPLLPKAFRRLVFRPQGWTSAVVLVGGRIGGVWEYTRKTARTTLTVRMFAPPKARVRKAVVAEAERLDDFLDTDAGVEFAAE